MTLGVGTQASEGAVLRLGELRDVEAIAKIWHDGWRDGHLGHVPDELLRARTLASFAPRVEAQLGVTTVAIVDDKVAGFTMLAGDEVEQVYVAEGRRGTGVAAQLLDDAQAQLAAAGYTSTWLAVVAGNSRARAFYSKRGWIDDGPFSYEAAGPHGPIVVPCHRYTTTL